MPYTTNYSPAPLTFNTRPRMGWQLLFSTAWLAFVAYQILHGNKPKVDASNIFDLVLFGVISIAVVLSFFRRERIEIYPDQMIWSTTYFGFTRSKSAPLADVLGVEWNEGDDRGKGGKSPDYVEFYLSTGSVKACYGFTFEEFDRMRDDIRTMYPDLIKRWGQSPARSNTLTLLNLS